MCSSIHVHVEYIHDVIYVIPEDDSVASNVMNELFSSEEVEEEER